MLKTMVSWTSGPKRAELIRKMNWNQKRAHEASWENQANVLLMMKRRVLIDRKPIFKVAHQPTELNPRTQILNHRHHHFNLVILPQLVVLNRKWQDNSVNFDEMDLLILLCKNWILVKIKMTWWPPWMRYLMIHVRVLKESW